MAKRKLIIVVVLVLILALGIVGFISSRSQKALLSVDANVASTVYVNGKIVGTTPVELELSAQDVLLALTAQEANGATLVYSTTLPLTAGVKTIVKRNLAKTSLSGSGVVFTLIPSVIGERISIVSRPDTARVTLDGEDYGQAPITIASTEGKHTLTVRALGYKDYETPIQISHGFEVQVFVDLQKEI